MLAINHLDDILLQKVILACCIIWGTHELGLLKLIGCDAGLSGIEFIYVICLICLLSDSLQCFILSLFKTSLIESIISRVLANIQSIYSIDCSLLFFYEFLQPLNVPWASCSLASLHKGLAVIQDLIDHLRLSQVLVVHRELQGIVSDSSAIVEVDLYPISCMTKVV